MYPSLHALLRFTIVALWYSCVSQQSSHLLGIQLNHPTGKGLEPWNLGNMDMTKKWLILHKVASIPFDCEEHYREWDGSIVDVFDNAKVLPD